MESDLFSLPDGIRNGDTIVQIDGRKIRCHEDFAQSLEFAAARNRNTITVTLSDSRVVELTAAKETQGR
jgi:S1-C subfamily serine protease